MIKELVLASMMSFGVGIGTMQHEPMQKVEPYTIVITQNRDAEFMENFGNALYEFIQEEQDYNPTGKFTFIDNTRNEVNVYTTSWIEEVDFTNGLSISWYFPGDQENAYTLTEDNLRWISSEDAIVITNYEVHIQNKQIYDYLVSQQMAESGTMGTQIINNIKSGLGMIGDLASEFLVGFTALFWNTTQNQLTVLGIFSLVMLGIAITMAVIKLCMNLIRNNTGV